jgi:hypothetical protein
MSSMIVTYVVSASSGTLACYPQTALGQRASRLLGRGGPLEPDVATPSHPD